MGSQRTMKPEKEKSGTEARSRPAPQDSRRIDAAGRPSGLPLFLKGPPAVQHKLEIGAVDDPLEHDADAAAERVMRRPDQTATTLADDAGKPSATSAPPIVHDVLSDPGRPLDAATRAFFEPRFGRDFSGVRIHTDARAAESAQALGALGYSHGQEIVFGPGQYAPAAPGGRRLLAHELAHVTQRQSQPDSLDLAPVRRQVSGPASFTGAGSDFDSYLINFQALEIAAIADGYSFRDRITAFRKLYYDSASAVKTYEGAVIGGGVWNVLIPGAAATKFPPRWSGPGLKDAADYLRKHQKLTINGKPLDIGHFLVGVDAAKHPTGIELAAGMVKMRSNVEAATFIGDLGSVVTEYIHGSTATFRDTAMERSPVLDSYFDGSHAMAGAEDMAGNADAYAMSLDSSKILAENLRVYYAATAGGVKKRFTAFASKIGLGTLSNFSFGPFHGPLFSGASAAWRAAILEEVFNSALAYAAAKGWRVDVTAVFLEPGRGVFTPTFWELYWNVSGWVVDIFLDRIEKEVAKE
jgi:hypothetical protein